MYVALILFRIIGNRTQVGFLFSITNEPRYEKMCLMA